MLRAELVIQNQHFTLRIGTTGCSKWLSSKAAGESKPEAYPLGYVEDFDEPRTKLAAFFSILLNAACPPAYPSQRLFDMVTDIVI